MGVISNNFCIDVIVLFVIGIIAYYQWAFQYWKKRGIPYIKPSFPFGTMGNIFRPSSSFGEIMRSQYEESKKKGHKHVGLYTFTKPSYIPIDTEYIRDILTKNFVHFPNRGIYHNEKDDPLSAHIVALEGSKWRSARTKLTPAFSSGKMKIMFHILIESGKQLIEAMTDLCDMNTAVDIKDIVGHFTTDVIGSCAFGIDCNSFKDPEAEFQTHAHRLFTQTKYERLKTFLTTVSPFLAKKFGTVVTPEEVTTFFIRIVKETVQHRENNGVIRNDLLQILIDIRNNANSNINTHEQLFTIEELAAHSFIFYIAGFETSSTTMTFGLYELAQNPHIQEKARDEIKSVLNRHNGELTYESLSDMKYVKQIIDEVLRKYPPFAQLSRMCVKDCKIPNSNITIEKGIKVTVSVYGLHHDPKYFPDPETFDPERFSEENKKHIKPYTYMPFGEGPRICIGMRFGLMQVGVGLVLLLKNFKFSTNKKTTFPLKMNPFGLTLSVLDGVWLNVEKL